MTHIANQRIKMGGKYYMPGDPIAPSEDELADLPTGAVSPADEAETSDTLERAPLSEEQTASLKAAIAKLKPSAFKQDGEIRAGALKGLNQSLGFIVSADDVAAVQGEGE
jgi:hypothetical protein